MYDVRIKDAHRCENLWIYPFELLSAKQLGMQDSLEEEYDVCVALRRVQLFRAQ